MEASCRFLVGRENPVAELRLRSEGGTGLVSPCHVWSYWLSWRVAAIPRRLGVPEGLGRVSFKHPWRLVCSGCGDRVQN